MMRTLTAYGGPVAAGLDWRALLGPGGALRGDSRATGTSQPEGDLLIEADLRWVRRVQGGDEEAARALVERLYPTILRMVRSHLPRRTHEDDLTQVIYAKVFGKLDQYSGRVPLEHWVARIAINTCLNQLKHELVRPELRMSDLSEEQQAVVDHLTCTTAELPHERGSAARELLEKLLAELAPDDRLVITLLHLEERSTEEISRLTGWSVSWVKVRAFRARRKMREVWGRLFCDERW